MGLFSLINGLEAALSAADAAQARAPETQQTVHFLGSVPVNAVLVVDQNIVRLPDLPRRLGAEATHRCRQGEHPYGGADGHMVVFHQVPVHRDNGHGPPVHPIGYRLCTLLT